MAERCDNDENGEGCIALADLRGEMHTGLVELAEKSKIALEGVANFRKFQLVATRRLGFLQGAAWIGAGVFALFLVLLGWALTLVVPAAKIVMDDYYHGHPNAQLHHSLLNPFGEVYAAHVKEHPQSAEQSDDLYPSPTGRPPTDSLFNPTQ